ncbi:hypothetical protein FDZ59_04120 [Ehrlichia ruminantium]|nr:hypothetical protein FDZ59_04120 [Ehrlichia ruminantium]
MVVISIMSFLFKIKDSILNTRDGIIAVFTPAGEKAIQHTDDDVKERNFFSILLEFLVIVLLACILIPLFCCAFVCFGISDYCKNTCCVTSEEDDSCYITAPSLLSNNGSDCNSGLGNSSEILDKRKTPGFVCGEEQGSDGSFTVFSPCSVKAVDEMIIR